MTMNPYRAYNFRVEIDGIDRAGFQECSGLDSTQDPIDYREGTDGNITVRKLPGLNTYSNITLKWGIATDTQLYDWRKKIQDGGITDDDGRRNLSILLLNDVGEEQARWNLVAAWPTKWTGPTFNAQGSDLAIDTLELVHEGIARA